MEDSLALCLDPPVCRPLGNWPQTAFQTRPAAFGRARAPRKASAPANLSRVVAAPLDMHRTCLYAGDMSKMIQVRDVPDEVHSTLKARAAREGMSLSDFIKKELERTAERPTMREWLDGARQAKPISGERSAAQIVRELRDAR